MKKSTKKIIIEVIVAIFSINTQLNNLSAFENTNYTVEIVATEGLKCQNHVSSGGWTYRYDGNENPATVNGAEITTKNDALGLSLWIGILTCSVGCLALIKVLSEKLHK